MLRIRLYVEFSTRYK